MGIPSQAETTVAVTSPVENVSKRRQVIAFGPIVVYSVRYDAAAKVEAPVHRYIRMRVALIGTTKSP